MRRQPMLVRDAGPEDAPALVRLWIDAGPGIEQAGSLVDDAPRALAHIATDPDARILVGECDGLIVAMLHLRRAPLSPLHLDPIVHTSFLMVLPEFRGHGYAQALLEAAVGWAEEKDIHHVSAIAASNVRDVNRFLTRLGLGTVATVRLASTASLRKKLNPPTPGGVRSRRIGQVLAVRRSMRRHLVDDSEA